MDPPFLSPSGPSPTLVPFPSSSAPSSDNGTAFDTAPAASSSGDAAGGRDDDEEGGDEEDEEESSNSRSEESSLPFATQPPYPFGLDTHLPSPSHPSSSNPHSSPSNSNSNSDASSVDRSGLLWLSTPSHSHTNPSLPPHSFTSSSSEPFDPFSRDRPEGALGSREEEGEGREDVGEGPSGYRPPHERASTSSLSRESATVEAGESIGLGLTLREATAGGGISSEEDTTPETEHERGGLRGSSLMQHQLDRLSSPSHPHPPQPSAPLESPAQPDTPRTRLTSLPPNSLPRASVTPSTTTTEDGGGVGRREEKGKGREKGQVEEVEMKELGAGRPSADIERPMPGRSPSGHLQPPPTKSHRPRSPRTRTPSDLHLPSPATEGDVGRGSGGGGGERSPVVPMEFGHPRLDLGMIEYARWPAKAIYYCLPIVVFGHIPLTIFLDYSALFTLVQLARFPSLNGQPPSSPTENAWWVAVAAYALAVGGWLAVLGGRDVWWEFGRRRWGRRGGRMEMKEVYLSSSCFNLVSLRSLAHFSFLYRVRLAALPPLSKALRSGYTARWSNALAESCWWYAQNRWTAVTLLPRAGLCLAVLLAFWDGDSSDDGSDQPSRRDDSYFDDDGSLSKFAKAVLILNASWAAWRILLVMLSVLGLAFFAPLPRSPSAPSPPRRRSTYVVPPPTASESGTADRGRTNRRGWQDRLEARLGAAVLYCSSRRQWLESRQGLDQPLAGEGIRVAGGQTVDVEDLIPTSRIRDSTGSWDVVSGTSEATAQPPPPPAPAPAETAQPRQPTISGSSKTTTVATTTETEADTNTTTHGTAGHEWSAAATEAKRVSTEPPSTASTAGTTVPSDRGMESPKVTTHARGRSEEERWEDSERCEDEDRAEKDEEDGEEEMWEGLREASVLAQARSDLLVSSSAPQTRPIAARTLPPSASQTSTALSDIEEASNERSDTASSRKSPPAALASSSPHPSISALRKGSTTGSSPGANTVASSGERSRTGSLGERAAAMRVSEVEADVVERLSDRLD